MVPHSAPNYIKPVSFTFGNHFMPPSMANIFTPILLPTALHDLPPGYSQRLRKFNGERGYSAEEHLGWFLDWVDLEEVDHDDVKVRSFSQSLTRELRK